MDINLDRTLKVIESRRDYWRERWFSLSDSRDNEADESKRSLMALNESECYGRYLALSEIHHELETIASALMTDI